jgi:hypothetical protein
MSARVIVFAMVGHFRVIEHPGTSGATEQVGRVWTTDMTSVGVIGLGGGQG